MFLSLVKWLGVLLLCFMLFFPLPLAHCLTLYGMTKGSYSQLIVRLRSKEKKKKTRERNIPWPTEHVCARQSERPRANTRACTGPSRKLLTIQSCSKPNKTSPSELVLQVEHFPEKWKSLFWVYHQAGIPDYISCLVQKKKISPQWNRVGFQTLQPTREGTFHGISQLNRLSPLNNLIKC